MRRLIGPFARLFVVVAIAVAMTGASFAHRTNAPAADESLIAYVAAGGSLTDLCGGSLDAVGGGTCDACRLVDGAMVPAGAVRLVAGGAPRLIQNPAQPALPLFAQVANKTCPARAPPVV